MFWFVSAVVLLVIAVIDLATNLHLLVLRRLSRRRARRAAAPWASRPAPLAIDPTLDLDVETLLKALHGPPTA